MKKKKEEKMEKNKCLDSSTELDLLTLLGNYGRRGKEVDIGRVSLKQNI